MFKDTKQYSYEQLRAVALQRLMQGNREDAYYLCAVAMKRPEADATIKRIFAQIQPHNYIKTFNTDVRDAILKCMQEDGVEYQKLSLSWHLLLTSDPSFEKFFKIWDQKDDISEDDWSAVEPFLQEPYFYEGLRRIIVDNPYMEKVLVKLRRALLLFAWPRGLLKTKHLVMIGAIAELCFTNEYAFWMDEDEGKALESLPVSDVIPVMLAACYRPMSLETPSKLSPIAAFKRLRKLQVEDVLKQKEIKAKIPSLGNIQNEVSNNVQSMYEENPYPRWRYIPIPITVMPDLEGEFLVAGCGTSKSATSFALMLPSSNVTAIDISRASIAYGVQKKEEFGIKNMTHIQCDILNVEMLDKKFDFINSSGVLHHMADPVEGWKKLICVMETGGALHLGLYSTKAREAQLKMRSVAFEREYQPDLEGIRKFRKDIVGLLDRSSVNTFVKWLDFYSTSEVRDLVFHVQEKTYTIPELRKIMDQLGLEFVKMVSVLPTYHELYKEEHPDDPTLSNLDYWEEFEEKNPGTFANMYNFVCKRKGEKLNSFSQFLIDYCLY